jgi:hypothetical protein
MLLCKRVTYIIWYCRVSQIYFDNTPRFNYGRGQAYGQNYGRGHGYRQNFGRGQDNRQNGYRVNPQKENSQTDKKSENVGRGRGRTRPHRSEVKTNQSSIQGSIGVSSAAQEAGMYVEADIHQIKCKLLVDTGATVSIVTRKQPSFPAYLRLTRLPSTSNILFCKSIKPAFDLKQSKPIILSTVICATNACTKLLNYTDYDRLQWQVKMVESYTSVIFQSYGRIKGLYVTNVINGTMLNVLTCHHKFIMV